jgi:hypothetical protein
MRMGKTCPRDVATGHDVDSNRESQVPAKA